MLLKGKKIKLKDRRRNKLGREDANGGKRAKVFFDVLCLINGLIVVESPLIALLMILSNVPT